MPHLPQEGLPLVRCERGGQQLVDEAEELPADGLGHQAFSRGFALRFEGRKGTIIIPLDNRIRDPSVEHRFVERAVPQGLLQGGDRHPCIEQAGGIRVPQAMGAEPNADGRSQRSRRPAMQRVVRTLPRCTKR